MPTLRLGNDLHSKIMQLKYSLGLKKAEDVVRIAIEIYEKIDLYRKLFIGIGRLVQMFGTSVDDVWRIVSERSGVEPSAIYRLSKEQLKRVITVVDEMIKELENR